MSSYLLIGGSTPRTYITMIDATTGLRKTDATWESAGLALWYLRTGGSRVDITTASLASVNSAYASGGFIHVANGVYRLDLPTGAVASGADEVQIGGAITGGIVFGHLHPLTGQTLTATTLQITLPSIPNGWITTAGIAPAAMNGKGDWLTTLGTNAPPAWINAAAIDDGALDGKGNWYNGEDYPANFPFLGINGNGHVSRVTLVDTTTTNSDMRGTDSALLAASYTAPDNAGITALGVLLDIVADAVAAIASVLSGITSLADWLGALAGKTPDTVTRAEINATTAGANYNETTDSLEAIRDNQSGGGGDATLANQEAILAALQGARVIQVPSPNVNGNLVLTQGDTYDGIGNPRAQWNVTTDYTDGWTVVLTIRGEDDAVVYTTSGEVVSETLIAVTIEAPTGLEMQGCPGQWQGKYDLQLSKDSSVVTIALGTCYVNEDQTR